MNYWFYCHYANGDLFEAKGLLEGWRKAARPGDTFKIAHKHSVANFEDQPWLEQTGLEPWMTDHCWTALHGGTEAINIWIGRDRRYVKAPEGIYIEGHFQLHNDTRQRLGLEPLPGTADDYWPDVDMELAPPHGDGRKEALICNGYCTSGQGHNFDFSPAINSFSERHPEWMLWVTCKAPGITNAENVRFTSDWTGTDIGDLPKISVLSRQCALIVGRKSGPHVWAQSRTNWLDASKTFLCFTKWDIAAWNVAPENTAVKARRVWRFADTADTAKDALLEVVKEA